MEDERYLIYQKGFEAGKIHEEPSPKTVEEISCLKVTSARMEQKMDNMGSDIKDIKEFLKNLDDNLEKKFASKWTEKVLIWGGTTVGGALLLYSVSHIFFSK